VNDGPGRPSRGDILAGTFPILFGLAFALAGGACTIGWVVMFYQAGAYGEGFGGFGEIMLLVSIFTAGFGVLAAEQGVRRIRGRSRG
jgi:hypothetical protein